MKYVDVKPIHKKDKTGKENYRPISILPNLSRIYEKTSKMQTVLNNLQEVTKNSFNSFLQIMLLQMRKNVTY